MTPRRKGQRAASDGKTAFSLISEKKLLGIYKSMLECCLLRDELRRFQGRRRRVVVGPVAGHEAMLASLTTDLKVEDALSLPTGDTAAGFLKGQRLQSILQAAWPVGTTRASRSRKASGLSKENIAPSTKTTTAQLHVACGLALGRLQVAPGGVVAVLCSGPGATSACWGEALALASVLNLPIIFMAHDTSTGTDRFAGMARSARVHGVPLILTDALDAVALYRVVYESLSRARQGRGPTLIVCRSGKTRSRTKEKNALERMEAYLRQRGMFDPNLQDRLARRFLKSFGAASSTGTSRNTLRSKGL
jgi:pyruvate dehydrogenase E1 component alpha subunit